MKKISALGILAVLFSSCKENYDLLLRPSDVSSLVVEGVINVGSGPTTIMLSKTVKLNDTTAFKPETGAQLTIESKTGNSTNVMEAGGGKYSVSNSTFTIGESYRLRIKTKDNREYLSDYVVGKKTPPIDSISWKLGPDGLIIYVNTHDPSNDTRYYKWEFDETWEIRSPYMSDYKYTGGSTIVYSPRYNFQCWKYDNAKNVNIGSSSHLSADVISEAPIHLIPYGSEKLAFKYSALVRQRSITKEAYEYFQLLKKNTESIGTIFDPQPSELRGNIKSISHPNEFVIGYLTASDYTEQRKFVTGLELNWKFKMSCQEEKVLNHPDSIKLWVPNYLPWSVELAPSGAITHYYMSTATCVDCTTRGGSLTRPIYW